MIQFFSYYRNIDQWKRENGFNSSMFQTLIYSAKLFDKRESIRANYLRRLLPNIQLQVIQANLDKLVKLGIISKDKYIYTPIQPKFNKYLTSILDYVIRKGE